MHVRVWPVLFWLDQGEQAHIMAQYMATRHGVVALLGVVLLPLIFGEPRDWRQ